MTQPHDHAGGSHEKPGSAVSWAKGLGWFSIGLGLAEMVAPERIAEAFGLEDEAGLIRTYGAREIINGFGILVAKNPTPWIWGRVGGDVLDIATLATGLDEENPKRPNVILGLASLAGVAMLDAVCAVRLQAAGAPPGSEKREVVSTLTIDRPAAELLERWRDAPTLARVMAHFAEVREAGPEETHWRIRLPVGNGLSWTARNLPESTDETLAWQSLPGAGLPNEGSVNFRPAPANRGAVATLRFRFDPPGGLLGDGLTKLLGGTPGLIANGALRRFKSLVETGEIPTTEGQPAARHDTR